MAQLPLPTKKVLTLEAAKQVATAAEDEARKNGCAMTVCVVDDGGHLLYLARMDNALIASVAVAQDKAACAVRFKRPTKMLEDAVLGGRTVVMALAGAVPVEGGLPLIVDGQVIGGIGASGGSSAQDGQVAAVGVAALEAVG
jgi:uncharacterized protein GlcG (DUF336 family)